MQCSSCDRDAVYHAAYSGTHHCEHCLCQSVERRVRRRVREDALLPEDATPEDPVTWVIGLSGGKDSVVLTDILHDTFEADPRVDIVALTVHEGIEGYRDASLEACEKLVADRDIRHEVVSYAEEFGVRMDEVVEDDPENMAACAYCGVFRRDVLSRYADVLDADLLLTGHNLDDEAQTALMNVLEGDLAQIAKHYDASLGPMDDRNGGEPASEQSTNPGSSEQDQHAEDPRHAENSSHSNDAFVPRAKPLRDVPEKEVALYARFRDLPAHITECPHAEEAYRGEIQQLLYGLEDDHPGTRHSIMAGYEDIAKLAAQEYRGEDGADLSPCVECGSMTANEVCRTCDLLEALAV